MRVLTDQRSGRAAPALQLDRDARRALHDVAVREHEPVRREQEAGAVALAVVFAAPAVAAAHGDAAADIHTYDGGADPLDRVHDGA